MKFLSEGIPLSLPLNARLPPVELSFSVSLNTTKSGLVNLHLQMTKKPLQFCSGIFLQILKIKFHP